MGGFLTSLGGMVCPIAVSFLAEGIHIIYRKIKDRDDRVSRANREISNTKRQWQYNLRQYDKSSDLLFSCSCDLTDDLLAFNSSNSSLFNILITTINYSLPSTHHWLTITKLLSLPTDKWWLKYTADGPEKHSFKKSCFLEFCMPRNKGFSM